MQLYCMMHDIEFIGDEVTGCCVRGPGSYEIMSVNGEGGKHLHSHAVKHQRYQARLGMSRESWEARQQDIRTLFRNARQNRHPSSMSHEFDLTMEVILEVFAHPSLCPGKTLPWPYITRYGDLWYDCIFEGSQYFMEVNNYAGPKLPAKFPGTTVSRYKMPGDFASDRSGRFVVMRKGDKGYVPELREADGTMVARTAPGTAYNHDIAQSAEVAMGPMLGNRDQMKHIIENHFHAFQSEKFNADIPGRASKLLTELSACFPMANTVVRGKLDTYQEDVAAERPEASTYSRPIVTPVQRLSIPTTRPLASNRHHSSEKLRQARRQSRQRTSFTSTSTSSQKRRASPEPDQSALQTAKTSISSGSDSIEKHPRLIRLPSRPMSTRVDHPKSFHMPDTQTTLVPGFSVARSDTNHHVAATPSPYMPNVATPNIYEQPSGFDLDYQSQHGQDFMGNAGLLTGQSLTGSLSNDVMDSGSLVFDDDDDDDDDDNNGTENNAGMLSIAQTVDPNSTAFFGQLTHNQHTGQVTTEVSNLRVRTRRYESTILTICIAL